MSRAQIFRIPQVDAKSIESKATLTKYIKEHWSDKIKNGDVIWTLDPDNEENGRNEGAYIWFNDKVIKLDDDEENDPQGYAPSKIPCGSHGITSPYHWVDALFDEFGMFFLTTDLRQQISDNMKRVEGTKVYYSWFLLNDIKYPVMINTKDEEDTTAKISRVRRSVMDKRIPFAHNACSPFLVPFRLVKSKKIDPIDSKDDMGAIEKDFKDMKKQVDELDCATSVMYGSF
jgi:hypothetical protein